MGSLAFVLKVFLNFMVLVNLSWNSRYNIINFNAYEIIVAKIFTKIMIKAAALVKMMFV